MFESFCELEGSKQSKAKKMVGSFLNEKTEFFTSATLQNNRG